PAPTTGQGPQREGGRFGAEKNCAGRRLDGTWQRGRAPTSLGSTAEKRESGGGRGIGWGKNSEEEPPKKVMGEGVKERDPAHARRGEPERRPARGRGKRGMGNGERGEGGPRADGGEDQKRSKFMKSIAQRASASPTQEAFQTMSYYQQNTTYTDCMA
ncbi:hypothetical protein SLA2020_428350, partial [Shorea laevis]